MASQHTTRRRVSSLDDESREMLYDGLNLSQLSIAFRMDHRVLVEKLHGVPATGERNGTETWRLDVAAPHLVKPVGDIETYLKRMHHNDLPKHLSKEFWAALKTRQEVEERYGDLWPTDRVVSVFGALAKLMKMSVRLMCDGVEQQAELTDTQRRIVKQLGDSMLEQMYASVREQFKPKRDRQDNPMPVGEAARSMSEKLHVLLQVDDEAFDAMVELAELNPKIVLRVLREALREEEEDEL
jgi:hypothetical protein